MQFLQKRVHACGHTGVPKEGKACHAVSMRELEAELDDGWAEDRSGQEVARGPIRGQALDEDTGAVGVHNALWPCTRSDMLHMGTWPLA